MARRTLLHRMAGGGVAGVAVDAVEDEEKLPVGSAVSELRCSIQFLKGHEQYALSCQILSRR